MNKEYVDRNGRVVRAGDILKYDEGEGYGQGIDKVVLIDGELHGLSLVGPPKWTMYSDERPINLKFYTLIPESLSYMELSNAEVIPNESEATVELAERVFAKSEQQA